MFCPCFHFRCKEIKIHSSFFSSEFAENYNFLQWLSDEHVDTDLRTLLKSVIGSVPYIDLIIEEYEEQNQNALEMYFHDKSCLGLGLASNVIFNTVTFSFESNNWNGIQYPVIVQLLTQNEEGNLEVQEEEGISRNISSIEHVEAHADFIISETTSQIEDGRELWARREELFPNLRFCTQVKNQLSVYYYNTLGFQQIIARLISLQDVASKLNGIPIKPEDFQTKTTRESETRLRLFENELTILCPDGKYRLFDWHVRFTPGAGRIHFSHLKMTRSSSLAALPTRTRLNN